MNDFLLEMIKRFGAKTPYFFKVLRWLAVLIAIITGLPELLIANGIDLPAAVDAVANKVVSIASIVGAFIAQLTVTEDEKKKKNIPAQ